jgi:hypothetical protein
MSDKKEKKRSLAKPQRALRTAQMGKEKKMFEPQELRPFLAILAA